MAGSGTLRVESADEDREIHVNKFTVKTDPYLLDSINFNGDLVQQYPRFASITPIANIVPNAGTLAFAYFDWGGPPITNIFRTNFSGAINGISKIPSITATTEINSVTGNSTHLYFPKGGLWNFSAYFTFNTALTTADTGAVCVLEYSTNSGGAWTRVGSHVTTIPTNPIPAVSPGTINWTNYFTEGNNGTVERIRFGCASSQAMVAGINLIVNATRLR